MAIIDSDNPHAKTTRDALDYLKTLSESLEGWTFESETDGVSIYTRDIADHPLPMLRGETVLPCSPDEFHPIHVTTAATLPGCRKIWDTQIEGSEVKQIYTRYESLFWVKMRAPWPIYPRDFCATSIRDLSDDLCYVSMVSVEDAQIPLNPDCVRGKLAVSGWKIRKVPEGIAITYITQVDLAGYIPYRFLKTIQMSVPLCAGKVAHYLTDHGFPPAFSDYSPSITFISEEFDHDARHYSLTVKATGDKGDIFCQTSKKMYPNGVKSRLEGTGTIETADKGVSVTDIQGQVTLHLLPS